MKNNLKKLLVLLLAANMFAGTALPTFAEEEKTIDGLTPAVTTETTESTDENGNPVITVTITETIGGGIDDETGEPAGFETTEAGVKLNYEQTTETKTITDENGNEIGSSTVVDGTETREWDEEVKPGQEVPDVEVPLKPGEGEQTVTVPADPDADPIDQVVTDNIEGGSTETNSDITTTTTTAGDRTVTAELSDVEITITESESDLEGAIRPEDYEGKYYDNPGKLSPTNQPVGLMNGLSSDYGPSAANKPDDEGYDFQLVGEGDGTAAACPVVMNVVYVRDENGNPLVDEDGNYVIDKEKSKLLKCNSNSVDVYSGMSSPGQMVLENDGEYFYVYCIDQETPAGLGQWYNISNLEDSDYYPNDESAAMLRAIVENGYWGTENGTGSLTEIKELLRETYQNGETVTVTDSEGAEHTYKIADIIDDLREHEALACTQAAIWSYSNGAVNTRNGEDGIAVVGVQSSMKYFSSKGSPYDAYSPIYNLESDARLKALYECLMGLTPVDNTAESVTTIINEKNNIEEMTLIVHDKAEKDADGNKIEANYDDDDTNDVYNTDLNFTLAFVPDPETDDLLVYITYVCDGEEVVVTRRLAGEGSEDENIDKISADESGVYTITGLQLSEGSTQFDLKLAGTQYLKNGVYIYTAHGGREASQTLVGMAEGTHNVDVTASMTLSFDVDETNHVVAEREWHYEEDPESDPKDPTPDPKDPTPDPEPEDPKPEPKNPTPEVKEPEVKEPEEPKPEEPKQRKFSFKLKVEEEPEVIEIPDEDIPLVNIPDEEIPLTDIPDEPVPMTGDTMFWYISSAIAALALGALSLGKKEKKNHNA